MTTLSRYFKATAHKNLSAVDVGKQHEIGSNKFSALLGDPGGEKLYFSATFIFFQPELDEAESVDDQVTWYDTRYNKPGRSAELRLYYKNNPVTDQMQEGDFCLLAVEASGKLLIAIARPGSEHERRLRYLFDLAEAQSEWHIDASVSGKELDLASTRILEALGIEPTDSEDSLLGVMIDRFGHSFPPTRDFSSFARLSVRLDAPVEGDADGALETWMQHEERLFRTLEREIVGQRIQHGFNSVDEFVSFSLSVQNRRKSRVGHALENHLEAVLRHNKVAFQRGARTEGSVRPDFLFPGEAAYRDLRVSSPPLRMLAAKTTCKDRWRQILSEAARIPNKHLCTLETAISSTQTAEMAGHGVTLVLPSSVARTYTRAQAEAALSLQGFVELVRA